MQFDKSNEYVQYLQKIYLSENQQERQHFKDFFDQESKQDINFLLNLINILLIDQYDNKIKQASLLYIKTYITTISESCTQEFLKIQSTILIDSLISKQIQVRHKFNLNDCLKIICLANQNNQIMKLISDKIILSLNNSNDVNSLVGGFLLLQTLFKINTSDHYSEIYENYMKQFCSAGSNLLSYIQIIFNEQITLQQSDYAQIVELLNILQIWVQTFLNIVKKFTIIKKKKKDQKELMKSFLSNSYITNTLSQILCISFDNQNQLKECVLSCTNIPQIDQGLNEIKSTLLEIYIKLYKYIQDYKIKDQTNTDFLISNQQLMIFLCNSLCQYCIKQNLFQQFQDRYLEELFVKLLQYIIAAMQPENYNLFCLYKVQIIINIIFPLLKTSPQELELFESNPQDFVNLALDTCDKQKSETIKTTAAKLLECFCDNVDGATTLTCNFSLQIINYSIFFDDPNNLDIQFPFLVEFKNSIFVDKNYTSAEQRIDTCFVVLSIISYILQNRSDLIQLLEQTIKQNKDNLFSIQLKNILKSRFCLFLGYYSDTIFSKFQDLDMFHLCIEFLVQSSLIEQTAVSYQAIDSLANIYDDHEMSSKLSQTVIPVFSKLIQNIRISQCNQFMDLIQNICQLFQKDLQEDQIVQCVCFLVERIQIECNSIESQQKTDQIFLNKCWNIIIEIVEINNYIPKYLIGIDNSLRPLLNYLQIPDKYGFEDDILQTIGILLQKSKTVTENLYNCLMILPQIFQRKNLIFGNLFQILYYCLIYGQQIFIQQPQLLQQIINMSEQALMNNHNDSNEADYAQGAFLLQVIIQQFPNLLGPNIWDQILNTVYERLLQNIESDYFKGRLLGIYLSSFLSNFRLVQQKLIEQGILDKIIDMLVNNINYYLVTYDAKMFIIGMSSILLEETVGNQFVQKLPQIFDFIVTLLKKQQTLENQVSQQKKKQEQVSEEVDENREDDSQYSNQQDNQENDQQNSDLNDEIYYDNVSDYEDIQDDDYDQLKQQQKQDKKTMENLNIQFDGIDEFEHFRQIIQQIKIKSEESLQKLIQTLSQNKQEYLKCILKTHRILNQDNIITQPRKIVKVKRRL